MEESVIQKTIDFLFNYRMRDKIDMDAYFKNIIDLGLITQTDTVLDITEFIRMLNCAFLHEKKNFSAMIDSDINIPNYAGFMILFDGVVVDNWIISPYEKCFMGLKHFLYVNS